MDKREICIQIRIYNSVFHRQKIQEKHCEKDYKKQLQKKNLDSTLFEDTGLTDEDIEEMRLPANYFVLNPLREDTAESTIEAFVRSIQKVDMGRALAYCMDESPE